MTEQEIHTQQLIIWGKMEVLITEREMAIAENKQRDIQGLAIAYTEDAFSGICERMETAVTELKVLAKVQNEGS